MFNKKLSKDAFSSLICQGTELTGQIYGTGALSISGTFRGTHIGPSDFGHADKFTLIVGKTGEIICDTLNAEDVIFCGRISAKKIVVEDTLRIEASAVIKDAAIYYRTLEIEPGAVISGCSLFHLEDISDGDGHSEDAK